MTDPDDTETTETDEVDPIAELVDWQIAKGKGW